jgi:hypothetical protein
MATEAPLGALGNRYWTPNCDPECGFNDERHIGRALDLKVKFSPEASGLFEDDCIRPPSPVLRPASFRLPMLQARLG